MTRWAIAADLNRCVGCQTCTASCKHANATAPGVQWRKVIDVEAGEYPDVRRAFMPVGCMHCEDAPCMDVCPTTATRIRDDGIVTIDYDLCIGCAYCIVACPYQARSRVDLPAMAFGDKPMRHEELREDPARIGVAQKCTFCVDRIDGGLAAGLTPGVDPEATPACVNSCIAGALHFGDTDDPDSNMSKLLNDNRHFRMHEELETGSGFYYLWDKARDGDQPVEGAEMIADPVGMAAISPKLQTSWDWRAAANFVFGGTGTALFAASTAGAMVGENTLLPALLALALVGLGLFCVFLEIGRPFRFINVLFHARRSWMTREAMAAAPFFGAGFLGLVFGSTLLGVIGTLSGLVFLYCQGRILMASKGIAAWRQQQIVELIIATGLVEGTALFAIYGAVAGFGGVMMHALTMILLFFMGLRIFAWHSYRAALGEVGAPTETFKALDATPFKLTLTHQVAPALLLVAGIVFAPLLSTFVVAGAALALASGWLFKYRLITRAAFNQGYSLNRMPVRGAGDSAAGVKPGWTKS